MKFRSSKNKLISVLLFAACFTPIAAQSEVPEYPATDLAVISRIEIPWIEITTLSPYNPDNPANVAEIHALARFGCRLNNRMAVALSEVNTNTSWFKPGSEEARTARDARLRKLSAEITRLQREEWQVAARNRHENPAALEAVERRIEAIKAAHAKVATTHLPEEEQVQQAVMLFACAIP